MRELEKGREGLRKGETHLLPAEKAECIPSLRKLVSIPQLVENSSQRSRVWHGAGGHTRMDISDGLALQGGPVGSRLGHELEPIFKYPHQQRQELYVPERNLAKCFIL